MELTFKQSQWLIELIISLIISLFTPTVAALPTPQSSVDSAPVVSNTLLIVDVIDGDTIRASDGSKIRLIGIDAPEVAQKECYADQSTQILKELIWQKEVTLVVDKSETDRYGRLLRYVYLGQQFINAELLEEGAAVAKFYPPDTHLQEPLLTAQQIAKDNKKGLWKACQ